MAGRPKRNPAVMQALIAHEFWWAVIFARIRFGMRDGDDSMPDPKRATKWRYLPKSKLWLNVETKRQFWAKDWETNAKEIETDFDENVVTAEPRDLPPEPNVWRALTSLRTKPAELRRICKQSQYLTGFYLSVLVSHATKFCDSKRGKRYPHAGLMVRGQRRPSSEDKRADYLARVMAGLSLRKPLSPATAVDLLRRLKHDKGCGCLRCHRPL
jgi:hypothetical protein